MQTTSLDVRLWFIMPPHSFIHSLQLYKIADKTLLSNVNRKNKQWMMKNYDEHPVFLKSMRVKKLLSVSEDDRAVSWKLCARSLSS